jgi:phosphoribosylamine--glycine ligase
MRPAAAALAARGTPLRGALYAGLMVTPEGAKVLEFNARFGDPETQVVLPLLDGDLVELCHAAATGTLASLPPPLTAPGAAVSIVVASGGYPGPIQTGLPIDGLEEVPADVLLFHAGTRRDDTGRIVTAGGRVLNVVGCGPNLAAARERAHAGARAIAFQDAHFRTDIGLREPQKA